MQHTYTRTHSLTHPLTHSLSLGRRSRSLALLAESVSVVQMFEGVGTCAHTRIHSLTRPWIRTCTRTSVHAMHTHTDTQAHSDTVTYICMRIHKHVRKYECALTVPSATYPRYWPRRLPSAVCGRVHSNGCSSNPGYPSCYHGHVRAAVGAIFDTCKWVGRETGVRNLSRLV